MLFQPKTVPLSGGNLSFSLSEFTDMSTIFNHPSVREVPLEVSNDGDFSNVLVDSGPPY
jgi:hypothetical protein